MTRIIMYYIYQAIPYTITAVIFIIVITLTYLIAVGINNTMWRRNLKYHMDKVYIDELKDRDIQIRTLKIAVRELQEEKDKWEPRIKAIRKILN